MSPGIAAWLAPRWCAGWRAHAQLDTGADRIARYRYFVIDVDPPHVPVSMGSIESR